MSDYCLSLRVTIIEHCFFQGQCFLQCLNQWKAGTSNLIVLAHEMVKVFSAHIPVYSTKNAPTPGPTPGPPAYTYGTTRPPDRTQSFNGYPDQYGRGGGAPPAGPPAYHAQSFSGTPTGYGNQPYGPSGGYPAGQGYPTSARPGYPPAVQQGYPPAAQQGYGTSLPVGHTLSSPAAVPERRAAPVPPKGWHAEQANQKLHEKLEKVSSIFDRCAITQSDFSLGI